MDNYSYNTGNYQEQQPNYYNGMDTSPMSLGDWILTILALCIPCAGVVLYFVWAFSKTGNINRRNFCRAALILEGIVLVIYILMAVFLGVAYMQSGSGVFF